MAGETKKLEFSIFSVIPVFLQIALVAIISVFRAPFRGSSGAPTYRQAVSYAVIRTILSKLTVAQSQGLSLSTEKIYEIESKRLKCKINTIDLGDGAKGHWMGPADAEYVMLYFHGGGYIGHATTGHVKYQYALQQAAKDAGHQFTIFTVSYTLAPHRTYPDQLSQATRALKYLIEHDERDPQSIFLAGDSAGGNLASALLLHIVRPHPDVEALHIPSKLHGALLISPWISFDTSYRSYTTNEKSDYITKAALDQACSNFLPTGQRDAYSEPAQAPAEWWASVAEEAVEEVMVWGGGGEILIDGIRAFAGTMAEGFAFADASIQAVRTSAAQRRSMAVARHLSGVDEAALKEAHWTGTNVPETTADSDAAAKPAEPAAKPAEPAADADIVVEDEKPIVEQESRETEQTEQAADAVEEVEDPDAVQESPPETTDQHTSSGDFIIDIDDAATRRRLGTERVFYLETPRAAHEEQIMNHTLKITSNSPSATVIEDWLRRRL